MQKLMKGMVMPQKQNGGRTSKKRSIMRVKKRTGKKTLMRIQKMKRLNLKKKKGLLVLKRIRTEQRVKILRILPLCLRLKKGKIDCFSQQRCA